jgi:hypothetical protein
MGGRRGAERLWDPAARVYPGKVQSSWRRPSPFRHQLFAGLRPGKSGNPGTGGAGNG